MLGNARSPCNQQKKGYVQRRVKHLPLPVGVILEQTEVPLQRRAKQEDSSVPISAVDTCSVFRGRILQSLWNVVQFGKPPSYSTLRKGEKMVHLPSPPPPAPKTEVTQNDLKLELLPNCILFWVLLGTGFLHPPGCADFVLCSTRYGIVSTQLFSPISQGSHWVRHAPPYTSW